MGALRVHHLLAIELRLLFAMLKGLNGVCQEGEQGTLLGCVSAIGKGATRPNGLIWKLWEGRLSRARVQEPLKAAIDKSFDGAVDRSSWLAAKGIFTLAFQGK